jgi:competence protein ComEA
MLRVCLSAFALAACLSAHTFAQGAAPGAKPAPVKPTAVKPTRIVNLNTATVAELDALPGIGTKTAALIVEYRQKNGPFRKIEELMNVRGVGEKSFLKLKPQLTVSGAPKTEAAAKQ